MYSDKINYIFRKMLEHEKAVPRRVNHFIKVYGFAKFIAEGEGVDKHKRFIAETSALLHDIGIKPSAVKYGSSAGQYQQTEGPPLAGPILEEAGYTQEDIKRICFLIGNHHTYTDIDDIDYQILVEADFIVNIYEDNISDDAVNEIREKIFKTSTGKDILDKMFSGEWKKN